MPVLPASGKFRHRFDGLARQQAIGRLQRSSRHAPAGAGSCVGKGAHRPRLRKQGRLSAVSIPCGRPKARIAARRLSSSSFRGDDGFGHFCSESGRYRILTFRPGAIAVISSARGPRVFRSQTATDGLARSLRNGPFRVFQTFYKANSGERSACSRKASADRTDKIPLHKGRERRSTVAGPQPAGSGLFSAA